MRPSGPRIWLGVSIRGGRDQWSRLYNTGVCFLSITRDFTTLEEKNPAAEQAILAGAFLLCCVPIECNISLRGASDVD